jgi:hypothetical protein
MGSLRTLLRDRKPPIEIIIPDSSEETICVLPDDGWGNVPFFHDSYYYVSKFPMHAWTVEVAIVDAQENHIRVAPFLHAIDDKEGRLKGPMLRGSVNHRTGRISFVITDNTHLKPGYVVKLSYATNIFTSS